MDKLVWETTLCFNDKFLLEPKLEITQTSNQHIPKDNNDSIFLRYYLPAPKYKDLIKNDNYNLSLNLISTTDNITPTSNLKKDFKIPHTIIPLQKAQSSYYYKNRKNIFFNRYKESQNGLLKPLSNVFYKDRADIKANILNSPATTSPLTTNSSKIEISFTNAISSTPIHKSFSFSNFHDKENFFSPVNAQLNKNGISKFESPDNIIEILDMSDKNTDLKNVQMEDIRDNNGNSIENAKPLSPNSDKSFDSLLNKPQITNSESIIKKKFDSLLVIDIEPISVKQNMEVEPNNDINTNSSNKSNIKKLSSSDKSLTPTFILTSSSVDMDIPSNQQSSKQYTPTKDKIENNLEKKEVDDDDDDDEPINRYITNKKRLSQELNDKGKISSFGAKRKDIINAFENVKKKKKLNTFNTIKAENHISNKIKTLEVSDEDEQIDKKKNNENKDKNLNFNIFAEKEEIKENILNKYTDNERDSLFLYDLCNKINTNKKYWDDKYDYSSGNFNKKVWAFWEEDKCYYVGKIVKYLKRSNNYRINFLDGSRADVEKNKVRPYDIQVDDIVSVYFEDDVEYNGIYGLCIVQIKKKISEDKFEAVILNKTLNENDNSYKLLETNKVIKVLTKNFVLHEEIFKIIDEQKLEMEDEILYDNDNFQSSGSKLEYSLKNPKTETNKIFEGYSFIVTVGGEESVNQMKKSSNTENQTYVRADKAEIQNQIEKMGGIYINNFNTFINSSKQKSNKSITNLLVIASIPSRTEKFLFGLTLKLPIISYNWIKECIKAEKFLSYDGFLLSHGFSKELNSYIGSYYTSNELFNNLKFYLVGNTKFKSTYKLIITYSGGIILSKGQFNKNPNQCHVIYSSKITKMEKKQLINKIDQLLQEQKIGSGKRKSVSRSSSFLTNNGRDIIEQTEGEMEMTEDEILDTEMTTEYEEDLQSSYRNLSEASSFSLSTVRNQPYILEDEWIIQCLINQRIVDYINYQINK